MNEISKVTLFQFHKVRLKVLKEAVQKEYLCKFQFHKVRLKACSSVHIGFLKRQFQFHKVRLKGNRTYLAG